MGILGGLVEILSGRRGVRRDHGGVPSDEEVLAGAASAHRICLYFLASGRSARQEAHGDSKRALLGHQWDHGGSHGGPRGPCGDLEWSPGRPQGSRWGSERRGGFARSCVSPLYLLVFPCFWQLGAAGGSWGIQARPSRPPMGSWDVTWGPSGALWRS
eukprot:gene13479-biopygen9531